MPESAAAASCNSVPGAARSTSRREDINSSSVAAADSSGICHLLKEICRRRNAPFISSAAAAAAAVELEPGDPGGAVDASMPIRPAVAADSSSSSIRRAAVPGGSSLAYAVAAATEGENKGCTVGVAAGESSGREDVTAAETDIVCSRTTERSSKTVKMPTAASENSNNSGMSKKKVPTVSDKRSKDMDDGIKVESVIDGEVETRESRFWKPELFEESVQLLRRIEQCIAAIKQQQQEATGRAEEAETGTLPLLLNQNERRRGRGSSSSNHIDESFLSSAAAATQVTTKCASPVPPVVRESAAAATSSPHPVITPHATTRFTLRPPPAAITPEAEAAAKQSRSQYEEAADIYLSSSCCARLSSAASSAAPASPNAATAWKGHADACCAAAASSTSLTQRAVTPAVDTCPVAAAPRSKPHLHTSFPAVAASAAAPRAAVAAPGAAVAVPATAVACVPAGGGDSFDAAPSFGVARRVDSAAANAANDNSSSSNRPSAAAVWDDRAAARLQQRPYAAQTGRAEEEESISGASATATEASAAAAAAASSSFRDPSSKTKSQIQLLDIATCLEIERAIELLVGVFRLVGPAAVVVSFNGGKDAVATLHLYRAALARFVLQTEQQEAERQQQQQQEAQDEQQVTGKQRFIEKKKIEKEEKKAAEEDEEEEEAQQKKKQKEKVQGRFLSCVQAAGRSRIPRPKILYFDGGEEEIEEVAAFVQQTARDFDLDITVYTTDLSQGMQDFVKRQRAFPVLAVLLGTRRGDPNARDLAPLQVSDAWLPPFLRVHPVAEFSYGAVWQFLKTFHLPYCLLYDRGYTSLGRKHDTMPNPNLISPTPTPRFLPADQLLDWSQERAGRRPRSDCGSLVAAVAGAHHAASATAAAAGTSFSVPSWQTFLGFAPTAITYDTRDTWPAAEAGACAARTTVTSPMAERTAVAATTQVDDDVSTDVSSTNITATRCAAFITQTRDASAYTTATGTSPVASTAVTTRASTCRRKSFAAALSLVATVAGSAAAGSASPFYPSVSSTARSAPEVSVYAGKLQHQMPDTVREAVAERDDAATNECTAS